MWLFQAYNLSEKDLLMLYKSGGGEYDAKQWSWIFNGTFPKPKHSIYTILEWIRMEFYPHFSMWMFAINCTSFSRFMEWINGSRPKFYSPVECRRTAEKVCICTKTIFFLARLKLITTSTMWNVKINCRSHELPAIINILPFFSSPSETGSTEKNFCLEIFEKLLLFILSFGECEDRW